MTMVTKPKSVGVSRRARIIVAIICVDSVITPAAKVAPAPRTVSRRSSPPPVRTIGTNSPSLRNGFKLAPAEQ